MTEVDDQLKLLEESSRKLNQESNSLNSLIDKVEKRLGVANPGIPVQVRAYGSPLAFDKFGDEWRLLAVVENENDEEEYVPLSNTSRAMRIEALKSLPFLIRELDNKVKDALSTIEEAKSQYDK